MTAPLSREEGMGEAPWVVWSNEHNAWWRANHRGYCNELLGAGIYTEAEARNIADNARSHIAGERPPEVAMAMHVALNKAAAGVTGDTVVSRLRAARLSEPRAALSEDEVRSINQAAAVLDGVLAASYATQKDLAAKLFAIAGNPLPSGRSAGEETNG